MMEKRLTGGKIAKKLDVSRVYVNEIINLHFTAPHIQKGIAETLGLTYEETWGEPEPEIKKRVG